MKFHLEFPLKRCQESLSYNNSLFFIGSCFSEDIGAQLSALKFDTLINPSGVIYHPFNIADTLRNCMTNKKKGKDELFFHDGLWHSRDHHSRFSSPDADQVIAEINSSTEAAHRQLQKDGWVFITFGSAFFYSKDSHRVANCHKLPAREFIKSLATVEEMVTEFRQLAAELRQFNPLLKIILTVSPVRHIRDGVVENNRSKARLLETAHLLCEEFPYVFYFPAYELVIDDLRDYRFYAEDLVHPSSQAVSYVFSKLQDFLFEEETRQLVARIQELLQAAGHRPFQPGLPEHHKFMKSYAEKCRSLADEFPFLDLSAELGFFSS